MAFLEIKNLKKSFGSTKVLHGIDFSMEEGEVVAVLGSSGGGKTTFLRCLNFLEMANEGTIEIAGGFSFDAAKAYTPAEIRSMRLKLGLVFQSFNLFPQYTALENVYLPLQLRTKEKIRIATKNLKRQRQEALSKRKKEIRVSVPIGKKRRKSLATAEKEIFALYPLPRKQRRAALLEKRKEIRALIPPGKNRRKALVAAKKEILALYPNQKTLSDALTENKARAEALLAGVGLSDKMNNYPWQLSGGQQQRVAIARALAQEPAILCFDEPTSALDPELTGEVLRVIRELKDQGRTMLVVTHEMEFAKNVADRIIFFADGLIEEDASPEEFFTNPKSPKAQAFLSHARNSDATEA